MAKQVDDLLARYRDEFPSSSRLDDVERALAARIAVAPAGGGGRSNAMRSLRVVGGAGFVAVAVWFAAARSPAPGELARGFTNLAAMEPGQPPAAIEPSPVPTSAMEPAPPVTVPPVATADATAVGPTAAASRRKGRARSAPALVAAAQAEDDSSLERELALIDRARSAIARGQCQLAIDLAARHVREFPNGSFIAERMLLQGQSLCACDRADAGRAVLATLQQRSPNTVWSERASQSCR